jgi:hypothetical protein
LRPGESRDVRVGGEVALRRVLTAADYERRAEVERRAQEWRTARAEAEANATDYPVDTGYGGIVNVAVEPVLTITENEVELRQPQVSDHRDDHGLLGLVASVKRRTER